MAAVTGCSTHLDTAQGDLVLNLGGLEAWGALAHDEAVYLRTGTPGLGTVRFGR